MQNNKSILAYLSVIFAMVFWSMSFVWIKIVFQAYSPITATVLRLVLSSIMILSFGLLSKKLQKIHKEDYKWIILLAFFEPFLYFIGETGGMFYVSSTLGAVIISTIPMFCPIAEFLFFKEKIKANIYIGIFLSIIGVCVISMSNNLLEGNSFKGIALLGLAIFSGVGQTLMIRKISARYNAITIVAMQNSIGTILFLPIFFIFEFDKFITISPSRDVIEALIYLSFFASTLAFVLYTYSIGKLGISKSVVFCNVIPVFTAIFAYFILGEEITLTKFIGIGIVIFGLFLSQKKFKRKSLKF